MYLNWKEKSKTTVKITKIGGKETLLNACYRKRKYIAAVNVVLIVICNKIANGCCKTHIMKTQQQLHMQLLLILACKLVFFQTEEHL